MKQINNRKNIRLINYDYSQEGMYYITICTQNRKQILSEIQKKEYVGANCVRPKIILSEKGQIVNAEIRKISDIYENIKINTYVIMPNHIHLIICISGRTQFAPTISRIIKQFKGKISKRIDYSIWQKNYYEHVIRNEEELYKIIEYIEENPEKWDEDKYYKKG